MSSLATSLNIENAWNSVALEERVELVAKSQAFGVFCGLFCLISMGSLAYGFNAPSLLIVAVAISFLIGQIFSNRHWRKHKPATIMKYLAVRSLSRRYAIGFNIKNIDIVLIFKGEMREVFKSEEEKKRAAEALGVNFNEKEDFNKEVWICLLKGGVVILSEHLGGAKLEGILAFNKDSTYKEPKEEDNASKQSIIISSVGDGRYRSILIDSKYHGALYVFKKKFIKLHEEEKEFREKLKMMSNKKRKF